jgi:hypothetical protein
MRNTALILLLTVSGWGGDAFGTWTMDPARSTANADPRPKSITIRIEPHAKGEVFTLDETDRKGRSTTSSTILYLDNKSRDFQGFECSGSQSSRRLDTRTVEILRTCVSGEWTRLVRRLTTNPQELVLEITEQQPDGGGRERRWVLKRFSAAVR